MSEIGRATHVLGPAWTELPLTPERFKIQFTVSRETHDRLRHAENLSWVVH